MRVILLIDGHVYPARVRKVLGKRSLWARPTAMRTSGDWHFMRRDYRTTWVIGWDGEDARAMQAQQALLKD